MPRGYEGICPKCGRQVAARADGRLAIHKSPAARRLPAPTTTDPAPVDPAGAVAAELGALTILKDAVAEAIDDRRNTVRGWQPGSKHTLTLPNPDRPTHPIKVGEVRLDGGQSVAAVTDRAAWLEWNRQHSPHNVHHYYESRRGWALTNASAEALCAAAEADADPWADPLERARRILDALEAAGYTLATVETEPAHDEVEPAWEETVLKASKAAGRPTVALPSGEVLEPDGITVTDSDPRPYVTVTRDPRTRATFLDAVRDQLPGALPAQLAPPDPEGT